MHFFRYSYVGSVLEYPEGTLSSCIIYTLRFSALASCVTLPPASMQSCAQYLFALTTKSSGTILSVNPEGVNLMDEANKKLLFLEVP